MMMALTSADGRAWVANEEVAAGASSFEVVFAREREPMLRLAYLLLGSESMAEEAVQDAFARLLDAWSTVANPGGFVRTATVNRCRDLLRRRTLASRVLLRFRPEPVVGPGDHYVLDLLASLDRDRREVLVLRFYLGHTTAEIAALLGVPEGTVRSRMQRGIEDLRGALA